MKTIHVVVLALIKNHNKYLLTLRRDTNPQMNMAADLESRLNMASEDPYNMEVLNEEILLRIDILILELCRSLIANNVYDVDTQYKWKHIQ